MNPTSSRPSLDHFLLVEGYGQKHYKRLCYLDKPFEKFYKLIKQKKSVAALSGPPPKGTLFFDSIKVIREI